MIFCLLLPSAAYARAGEYFSLESGETLDQGEGAFSIWGGYPYAGMKYILCPTHYFDTGIQFDVDYEPTFGLGVPLKVQLLESSGGKLNFALSFLPNLNFRFAKGDVAVYSKIFGGFDTGWKIYRGITFFLRGHYAVELPISEIAEFAHYPRAKAGFEFPVLRTFNIGVEGFAEFKEYKVDDFVYGGNLILSFALWD